MMQSKTWLVLLTWLIRLESMAVMNAVVADVAVADDDDDGVEDAFVISKHAHVNRDNYFHMWELVLGYPAYILVYFANDECS